MANPVKFQANAVDDEGNVLPNAQISVVGVVSGLPVSLFSDFDLSAGISNPFNAEADGSFEFYCENERANLIVIKDGFSRTWNDLFLKNDGAWATADNSNDSSFSTGWYVTPQGYKARYDYQLTQPHNWSGTQDFATVNIDDAIIDTVSGTNNASGSLQVNGQSAFNGPLSIKDLTTATAPRSLINLNGDLQWGGQKFTGTASTKDLTSPSAIIWDDGNLVKTISNIDTTGGRVMLTGNGGLLATQNTVTPDLEAVSYGGMGSITSATSNKPASLTNGVFIQSAWANTVAKGMLIIDVSADRVYIKRNDGTTWQPEFEIWTKANTTVDINGFIKEL